MATIIKTPAGTFRAIIRTKNKSITKTFKKKGLATEWAKRIEGDADLIAATGCKGASIPFSQCADEFHDQWTGKDDITGKISFWKAQLGNTPLTSVDDIQVDDILTEYSEGAALCGLKRSNAGRKRAPATVNRMRALLSSIFVYAIKKKKYIKKNPVKTTNSFKEPKGRTRRLSDEERPALLSACRDSQWDRLYLLVLMALTTGARQGELLGLHWDDIDFKERTALLIDTKNGESRILSIPLETMTELLRFREIGSGLLFPSPTKFRKPFEFRKHWHKAMAGAGIVGFRFHDLRHSCASMMINANVSLTEIGRVLGHKSTQTTLRYAHMEVSTKQEIMDRVMEGVK